MRHGRVSTRIADQALRPEGFSSASSATTMGAGTSLLWRREMGANYLIASFRKSSGTCESSAHLETMILKDGNEDPAGSLIRRLGIDRASDIDLEDIAG